MGMSKKKKDELSGMNLGSHKEEIKETKKSSIDFKKYVNKKTIAITSMSALALGGLFVGTNVNAQEALRETTNEVSVKVMKTRHSSNFENKKTLQKNDAIQTESKEAMSGITSKWKDNSVEEIRAEVERQREEGLDAYVVQWGDTISVLAEVIDVSVEELVEQNNLSDKHLILTGDILDGVLYQISNTNQTGETTDEDLLAISTDVQSEEDISDEQDDNQETESDENVNETDLSESVSDRDTKDIKENPEKDDDIGDKKSSDSEIDPSVDVDDGANLPDVMPTLPVEPDTKEQSSLQDFGEEPVADEDVVDEESDVFVGVDPDTEPLDSKDIKVGRQVVTSYDEMVEEEIPYETVYVNDPDLPYGAEVHDQHGAVGLRSKTVNIKTYSDDTKEETEGKFTTITEPIDEIIRVGSLESEDGEFVGEELEWVRTVVTEGEIETIEVDDLAPGKERVVEQGQDGVHHILEKITLDQHGDVVTDLTKVLDEDFEGTHNDMVFEKMEPKKTIIEVGRSLEDKDGEKVYDDHQVIEEEVKYPFEKHTIEIPAGESFKLPNGKSITLKVDEEYVYQEGSDSIMNITFDVYFKNEKEIRRIEQQGGFPEWITRGENQIVYKGIKK